jgi:hypothetical protein
MIPKRVQVAGIVAAVSLVAYFASALSDPKRAEPISYRLPQLTSAGVDEISISKNGVDILLKKQANGWRIAGPKFGNIEPPEADQTQVDGIIAIFKDGIGMDLSESFDDSKAVPFGFDKDIVTVTIRNTGQELTQFKIGKKAGPNRTFIMPASEPKVYRAMADMRRLFDKAPVDFRVRNAWQAQFEKMSSLTIQEPGGIETKLLRVAGPASQDPFGRPIPGPKVWQDESPSAPLDTASLDSIGRTLAYPKAADFADSITPQEAGIGQNFSFTITLEDGSTHTLLVGKKDDQGRAYAQRAPDGDLIIIDKYTVDTLLKSPFQAPASAPTSGPSSMPATLPAGTLLAPTVPAPLPSKPLPLPPVVPPPAK